jgi:hypothetical protein
MGDSAMVLQVRWWIESYRHRRRMIDRVRTALKQALNEDGIEYSDPTLTLNLQAGAAGDRAGDVITSRTEPGDGWGLIWARACWQLLQHERQHWIRLRLVLRDT